MATIAQIANLVDCGTNALGTGTKGCEDILTRVTSLYLTKRGFIYDASEDFSEAYIQQLQAEKKLIILKDVKELTPSLEEDVKETGEDGVMYVTRKGLYSFQAKFRNGFAFESALASLRSFGAYDVSFVDYTGNVLGTVSGTSFKGFSLGMLENDGITMANNSTRQSQSVSFQFIERDELDVDSFYISNTVLDWKPQRQEGVNQVKLDFTATPADAGTTISVKATLRQGGGVVTGAAFGDFLLTVDGVTGNPTAGDDSTTAGTYVLTVAALSTNEVLAISLYDNAESRAVISLDTDLYQSNTATSTVV